MKTRFAFLFLISIVSLALGEKPSDYISVNEATEFCQKYWFPALRFGKGLNSDEKERKLDQAMAFYTPTIELVDPNNLDQFKKVTLEGQKEAREYYRLVLSKYPEWEFEMKAIYPTSEGFILHYIGKNAPPVVRFEGVDILKIERGAKGSGVESFRIARLEGFYDRLPFTRIASE